LKVYSVPILFEGKLTNHQQMVDLIGRSHFIESGHIDELAMLASKQGLSITTTMEQTNQSDLMEGLYIKVETAELTVDRYKYVRADFLNSILDAGSHWLSRPIIPNQIGKEWKFTI
jgi:hypothetical protein